MHLFMNDLRYYLYTMYGKKILDSKQSNGSYFNIGLLREVLIAHNYANINLFCQYEGLVSSNFLTAGYCNCQSQTVTPEQSGLLGLCINSTGPLPGWTGHPLSNLDNDTDPFPGKRDRPIKTPCRPIDPDRG